MDYTHYRSGSVSYTLSFHNWSERRFYIPAWAHNYFNEEFAYREVANSRELTDIAVALPVCLIRQPYLPKVVAEVRTSIFLGWTRTMTICNGPPLCTCCYPPPIGQEQD